ncbi:hypothetical protein [Jiangella alkaliphila]|uniref:Uncharacterized protein n=1 Tax=Jiangella alkaliphila TaxID=419479 RepID=A0A1H2L8R2_9ACTN|nr:hypothetical protein [Jiangella alkaliphila]SDU77212.1 hypothetical protein SAMN04488563_5461 [Jiangella alkaliphila]
MSDDPSVRTWDLPIVRALDKVETLAEFEPDRVEWDQFRFWGWRPDRRMDMVSIYAFPPPARVPTFVRFAVDEDGFTVTGPAHRALTVNDVAHRLAVPIQSAELAVATLHAALAAALTEWNAAHAARAIQLAVGPPRQALRPGRHCGPEAQTPPPGIGL